MSKPAAWDAKTNPDVEAGEARQALHRLGYRTDGMTPLTVVNFMREMWRKRPLAVDFAINAGRGYALEGRQVCPGSYEA